MSGQLAAFIKIPLGVWQSLTGSLVRFEQLEEYRTLRFVLQITLPNNLVKIGDFLEEHEQQIEVLGGLKLVA